jgi:hypothetical protein
MPVLKINCSGGEFLLFRRIVFRLYAILEQHAGQQCFNLVGAANSAPRFFCFLDQLECEPKERRARHAIACACGAVTHRGKRRFNRIGRA